MSTSPTSKSVATNDRWPRSDRLQRRAFQAPFERKIDHDFVPHVTLTQGDRRGAPPARWWPAAAGWEGEPVRIDALHLLEERHPPEGKRWTPIADIALGPRIVVGRGGLELELTPGELVDPEAAVAAGLVRGRARPSRDVVVPDGGRTLVVAARRDGRVVGLARGWTTPASAELVDVWVAADQLDDVDDHLWAAWHDAAASAGTPDRGRIRARAGPPPARPGSAGCSSAMMRWCSGSAV